MFRNLLLGIFFTILPSSVFGQKMGFCRCSNDSLPIFTSTPAPPDTTNADSKWHNSGSDSTKTHIIDFSRSGIFPQRVSVQKHWENIPEECRINWHGWYKKPLKQLYLDLGNYFGTFDTTYVHRNRYDFGITLNNVTFMQYLRISASNGEGARQSLIFTPAYIIKFGPQFTWKALTVGYTFGVNRDKHNSRTSEFNVALYNSKVGFDLNYTSSTGNFELQSMSGFGDLRPQQLSKKRFEGISSKTLALNGYYVFNYRHFSYPAAYSLSTLQLRSAGSWIAGLRYDNQRVTFDAPAVEQEIQTHSPQLTLFDALHISEVRYKQISLSCGYGYNWVATQGLLFSGALAPSVGYKYQENERLTLNHLKQQASNVHLDLIFRAAVVWTNGQRYLGLSTVSYFYNFRYQHLVLNNNLTYIRLYFGYQFQRKRMFRRETWQQFAPWRFKRGSSKIAEQPS